MGSGLTKYAGVFAETLGDSATVGDKPGWAPTGAGLLLAFGAALGDGSIVGGNPSDVLPIYTRLSDAEEAERARSGLPSQVPPDTGVGRPPTADSGEAE